MNTRMAPSRTPQALLLSLQYLLLACLCALPATALFRDQAGQLDWHLKLVGAPRSVLFHNRAGNQSILVGTEKNVIAALQPSSGSIAWRQVLAEGEKFHANAATEKHVASVSSAGVRQWESATGALAWEHFFPHESLSVGDVAIGDDGNIFALSDRSVSCLTADGKDTWTTNFATGDISKFKSLRIDAANGGPINVLRITSTGEYEILSLERKSGKESGRRIINVPSAAPQALLRNSVTWIDKDALLVQSLTSSKAGAPTKLKSLEPKLNFGGNLDFRIIPFQDDSESIVIEIGEKAVVIDVKENPTPLATVDLPNRSRILAAAYSKDKRISFTLENHNGKERKLEILDASTFKVASTVKTPHDQAKTGLSKEAFIGPSGDVLYLNHDNSVEYFSSGATKADWTREEGLSTITSVAYVDLPERQMWSQENDELDELPEQSENISALTRFLRRLCSHLGHAKQASQSLLSLLQNAGSLVGVGTFEKTEEGLYRDPFGYRKLIIAASSSGKIYAIDSRDKGKVIWEQFWGPQSSFEPTHVSVVRSALVKYPPLVDVVGVDNQKQSSIRRINAMTGETLSASADSEKRTPARDLDNKIQKVFNLPVEESAERTLLLGLLDDVATFQLSSTSPEAKGAFESFSKTFYYASGSVGDSSLSGFTVDPKTMKSLKAWHLNFPENDRVVAVGRRPSTDKVASLGRVLGDRFVLYKYLNPNMRTYATYNPTARTLKLYVVDIVKGSVLYSAAHRSAGTQPVHVLQCENWVVYTYWSEGDEESKEKGYIAVVLDLFESSDPDVRDEETTFTSHSSLQPHVESRAFVLPYQVTALGVTTTRLGISSKAILIATSLGQIVSMPRRFLDARRPYPPMTAEQTEEMLIPYEVVLPKSGKSVITYDLEVEGTRRIMTTPALLESTSLVFSHGLDLFHTRLAPSKQFDVLSEDFSKSSLLATMAACAIGIAVARPMVRRKKVNASWQ